MPGAIRQNHDELSRSIYSVCYWLRPNCVHVRHVKAWVEITLAIARAASAGSDTIEKPE